MEELLLCWRGGRTCAEQVLQGVCVLQQAAGVQPGLQAVAVAVVAFRVIIKLLQAAVATELHVQGPPVARGAVRVVDPCFWKVLQACERGVLVKRQPPPPAGGRVGNRGDHRTHNLVCSHLRSRPAPAPLCVLGAETLLTTRPECQG